MIRAVVVDVEGTTSSLGHVREILFPYARERVSAWVRAAGPGVPEILDQVRAFAGRPDAGAAEVAAILGDWIDRDVKAAPLKDLQGLIWEAGFAAGELTAHVYDDVPPALHAWTGAGLRIHVYSSGSVLAQRLWFRNTRHGDLLPYFAGHFDITTAGPKREPGSYRRIAHTLALHPPELVFLSDSRAELDAARAAGLRTVGVSRPEDGSPDTGDHPAVTGFDRLHLSGLRIEVPDVA
ncbi:MAG TPA: acireductone synthase [Nonomuraea sp.]|nr:acireductone synthase [Nonomuraea sp.]